MSLLITEYEALGKSSQGDTILAGMEPALATQAVAIGGSSTASATFHPRARFIRLYAEAACHVEFGLSPTAANGETKLNADSPEYFGIKEADAGNWKIAVIQD